MQRPRLGNALQFGILMQSRLAKPSRTPPPADIDHCSHLGGSLVAALRFVLTTVGEELGNVSFATETST